MKQEPGGGEEEESKHPNISIYTQPQRQRVREVRGREEGGWDTPGLVKYKNRCQWSTLWRLHFIFFFLSSCSSRRQTNSEPDDQSTCGDTVTTLTGIVELVCINMAGHKQTTEEINRKSIWFNMKVNVYKIPKKTKKTNRKSRGSRSTAGLTHSALWIQDDE